MDPFPLLVAILPLAAYLLFFGVLRLSGRTLATTGSRDLFATSIAIMGLVAIGPLELFFPMAAAAQFGVAIWPVLVLLYFLVVLLIMLSSRPRLVVYGCSLTTLQLPLLRAAQAIDTDAKLDESAGLIVLPKLGLHLRLDGHRNLDAVEVFAHENGVLPSFWHRLLSELRDELAKEVPAASRTGSFGLLLGIALLGLLSWNLFRSYDQVVQGFREWWWR